MTNEEKYKTPEERYKAFRKFCDKYICDDHLCDDKCPCYKGDVSCHFSWLALEAEEEKPLPCPFCGGHVMFSGVKEFKVLCVECFSSYSAYTTKSAAIAAWNKRVK